MYTSTDLVKLRQIMAENPEHANIIESLLASHRESLSAITHEIRNPLTLIYSSIQLIESEHPEVHSFRHWEALRQDVAYTMHLLTELSSYNNCFSLHKQQLNISQFLKQLVLSFAASFEASNIEFTSCIAPALPDIQADAPKLKEALLNLLKNALEAFPNNSAGSIRLEADTLNPPTAADASLRIQIQDNGCGIPPERLDEFFTPFTTSKSGGTGLGLPLSKRIIEAHGGTLQVRSAPGKGSTFTILLPAASASRSI